MLITPISPSTPPPATVARVTMAQAAVETAATPSLTRDRWVSQTPVIPDPPEDTTPPDPWREVPETAFASALYGIGAGGIGAIIGGLVAGPVGAAVGAGIGTTAAQGFMQSLLGMADGGKRRNLRLAAALPAALSAVGGAIGGALLGAVGVTAGVLAAPLLAVAGFGVYKLLQ